MAAPATPPKKKTTYDDVLTLYSISGVPARPLYRLRDTLPQKPISRPGDYFRVADIKPLVGIPEHGGTPENCGAQLGVGCLAALIAQPTHRSGYD